jgi:chaperonin GroES
LIIPENSYIIYYKRRILPVLTLKNIEKFVVVGDRVLIRPQEETNKTNSGLYLPPGVSEKEKIQSGYIIKTGPGYPTASQSEDEPWKESKEPVKYIPLQAKEGDLAIFLRKEAYEIEFDKEKLLIVPQSAVLLLIRNDFLDI